jgi:hypothetical protein
MLSRTLSLATVTLMIAGFPAAPALAQNQNLEAGKSPSQIFAGTCTACHKGPRGLLKTVSPSSLQGFLRQHYTTSPDMASLLAGFLVSNGAADTRRAADQPKSGKPNPDGSEPGRQGHGARRSVRSEEPGAAEAQTPAQERGSPKQKLSKRAKPGAEEAPKAEAPKAEAAKTEAAKTEAAKPDSAKEEPTKTETGQGEAPKSETANEAAKSEGDKSQGNADSSQAGDTKPDAAPQVNSGKSESAGIESPSESSKSQTPASASDSIPSETAVPAPATGSVPVTSATTEPAAATVAPSTESARPSQAIAISAPPSVAPAGPPLPPISR